MNMSYPRCLGYVQVLDATTQHPNTPARRRAVEALRSVLAALDAGRPPDFAPAATGLEREIVHGSLRHLRRLEWTLDQLCRRRPERWTRALLLTALHQVLHTRQEPGVVVNASVEIAKHRRRVPGLVNAVLRRAAAERDELLAALDQQRPAVRWSLPDALAARWQARSADLPTDGVGRYFLQPPVTTARLVDPALPARWREAGVTFEEDGGFARLRGAGAVTGLPGFAEGGFYVQDPSTALAPALLAARPGERVLDACAAPGGKTMILAEAMAGDGELVAADASESRLRRLRENLARMRQTWVRVERADLLREPPTDWGVFDAILLDAPCSNTGVLGRRPEARWRFSEQALARLAATQAGLLRATWKLLRPGGRLVWSTCSIEPEENEELVAAFAREQADATIAASRARTPGDGGDGAFASLLRRSE